MSIEEYASSKEAVVPVEGGEEMLSILACFFVSVAVVCYFRLPVVQLGKRLLIPAPSSFPKLTMLSNA